MSDQPILTTSCRAMNTVFEVAVWGRERSYLESAAQEALDEVRRLEGQLSMFREDSDVYDLNIRAANAPVSVDPRLFRLLVWAKRLSAETDGAFDITIAPLLRAWGFVGGKGKMADPAEVEASRELVGMNLIELDETDFTVRFLREGVTIDLGAIGKGYAVEQAAEILRDLEVGGALIHGGTSSVQAVGGRPNGSAWPIAIQNPAGGHHLAIVPLENMALSISAVHGKFFTEGDRRYGHVLDPRIGEPVAGALLATVVCPSATESDALATALLVLGEPALPRLAERPDTKALLVFGDPAEPRISSVGLS